MPDGLRARLSILPFALLAMLTIHAVPCQTGYRPISGDLLEFWQTAYSYLMPIVYHVDPGQLPEGVSGLRIACVEVEQDSLDLFLLGTRAEGEIPLLLARGGYRGLYNTAKSDAIYVPEEDEYHILFQMPFSARYLTGCYRWDRASGSLVLLRITDRDASYETLDRADSLIAAGEIAEAIHIVGVMFYPSAYYDRDEMAARLFRAIDRTALELYREGDSGAAAELYRCMDEYFYVAWDEWVTLFTDAGDFEDCDFS